MSDLDELRAELDEFAVPDKKSTCSAVEERVIAGFEEIQRFVDEHGHEPQHGEDRDIFERLYAVRLDRIRSNPEFKTLLSSIDRVGLLSKSPVTSPTGTDDVISDDELLSELQDAAQSSITELRHVRSNVEIRAAEEIANREKCLDFDKFKQIFSDAERDLTSGVRQTRPFGKDASIAVGNLFILSGQMVYVAGVGELIKAPNGATDARLRVIFSNGTESNLLLRSLQRALYKDETGRRLSDPNAGPLFRDTWDEGDVESGTIYVLRSLSDHPYIAEHRKLVHKIGVTGGKVEDRIANAEHDATYLLAAVEVVATYKLAGINRNKLENLFHRIFNPAKLDLTIHDRFGHPVRPREWFLVPLAAIDDVVNKIRDGSIAGLMYDTTTATLK